MDLWVRSQRTGGNGLEGSPPPARGQSLLPLNSATPTRSAMALRPQRRAAIFPIPPDLKEQVTGSTWLRSHGLQTREGEQAKKSANLRKR